MVEKKERDDTRMARRRRKSSRRITATRVRSGRTPGARGDKPDKKDTRIGHIKVFEGEEKQDRVYPLKDKSVFYIGRSSEVDIPLSDMKISRKHCKIEKRGNRYRVVDLGSKNGTYLNGKRVRMALLSDGDQLRIGFTVLQFFLAKSGTHIVESKMKKRTCSLCGKDVAEADILAGRAEELEGNVYCPDCMKTVEAVDEGEMITATPMELTPPTKQPTVKAPAGETPPPPPAKKEEFIEFEEVDVTSQVAARSSYETVYDIDSKGIDDLSMLPPDVKLEPIENIEDIDIERLLEEE